jgi:hypothetical protein
MLQTDKFCRKNCFSSERISFPSERISLERNESLTRERTCSSERISLERNESLSWTNFYLSISRANQRISQAEQIYRISLERTNLSTLSRANESLGSLSSERISLERNESLTRERTCSSETNLSREQTSIFLFLERANKSHEPNKYIESLSRERISRLSLVRTNLLNRSRANESPSSETNLSRAKGLARAKRISLVNKLLSFYF